MPELKDLEVTTVAIVGKAANKRRFLVVKSAAAQEKIEHKPEVTKVENPSPAMVRLFDELEKARSSVQWVTAATEIQKTRRNMRRMAKKPVPAGKLSGYRV